MEPIQKFKLLAPQRPFMASLSRILRIAKPINHKEPIFMTNKTFASALSLTAILALGALTAAPAQARTRHHRTHHHHAAGSLASVVAAQPSLGQNADRSGLRAMVARHAAQNGVPFAIADAVVKVESNYNPRATNRSGAMGLMQIKTQTARGEGFSGGPSGLLNPETNIRFAMRYLATAYRMSGGDLCGTVMRYQSGHGARHMSAADHSYCAKARGLMASN